MDPDLNFEFKHDLFRSISERVISFEIDFGIVINPVRHPELELRQLCVDENLFWRSKKVSPTEKIDPNQGVLVCDPSLLEVQNLVAMLQEKRNGFGRIIHSSGLNGVVALVSESVGVGIPPR